MPISSRLAAAAAGGEESAEAAGIRLECAPLPWGRILVGLRQCFCPGRKQQHTKVVEGSILSPLQFGTAE